MQHGCGRILLLGTGYTHYILDRTRVLNKPERLYAKGSPLFDKTKITSPRDAGRALDETEDAIDRADEAIISAPRSELREAAERQRDGLKGELEQIWELIREKGWDIVRWDAPDDPK